MQVATPRDVARAALTPEKTACFSNTGSKAQRAFGGCAPASGGCSGRCGEQAAGREPGDVVIGHYRISPETTDYWCLPVLHPPKFGRYLLTPVS